MLTTTRPEWAQAGYPELLRGSFRAALRAERDPRNESFPEGPGGLVPRDVFGAEQGGGGDGDA
eukprot:14233633-Alexandrium_andersonii.AAC.1